MKSAGRCPYCGHQMTFPGRDGRMGVRTRSVDHIMPREWGGDNTSENRRIVCRTCNELRAAAGHCLGALACARAVSQNAHPQYVLNRWRLVTITRLVPRGTVFAFAILSLTWPGGQVTHDPALSMKLCEMAKRMSIHPFTDGKGNYLGLPIGRNEPAVSGECRPVATAEEAGFPRGWDVIRGRR